MASSLFPPSDMRLFTTYEFANYFDLSISAASKRLGRLADSGAIEQLTKGLWWQKSLGPVSRYSMVPKLLGKEQGYISFLSALNHHDIIDQIPGSVLIATTGYPRKLKTKVGTFEFIRLAPTMMGEGVEWVDTKDPYLMASPEKALLDTFYISTRKGKRFSRLPELDTTLVSNRKFLALLKKQVKYSSISESIKKKIENYF